MASARRLDPLATAIQRDEQRSQLLRRLLMARRSPVTLVSGVEVLQSSTLRVPVEVGEGDLETLQHGDNLGVVPQLVVRVSGVNARTRKHHHTERLVASVNRSLHGSQNRFQLANPIVDW